MLQQEQVGPSTAQHSTAQHSTAQHSTASCRQVRARALGVMLIRALKGWARLSYVAGQSCQTRLDTEGLGGAFERLLQHDGAAAAACRVVDELYSVSRPPAGLLCCRS